MQYKETDVGKQGKHLGSVPKLPRNKAAHGKEAEGSLAVVLTAHRAVDGLFSPSCCGADWETAP